MKKRGLDMKRKFAVCMLLLALPLTARIAGRADAAPIENVVIRKTYLSSYEEDPYVSYGDGHVSTVLLGEKAAAEYPALAESLQGCAEKMQAAYTEEFNGYAQEMRDWYAQDPSSERSSMLETDVVLRRADEQVFSFLLHYQMYAGGAHGYAAYTGYQFDTATGQEITLTDVVTDPALLTQVLEERLAASYPEWSGSSLSEFGYGENGEYPYIWVLGPQGITVFFNPYEIAAYAAGILRVDILFDEVPELFTGRYGKSGGAYAYQLIPWPQEYADLNGDGTAERITVEADDYDEYFEPHSLKVSINDRSAVLGDRSVFEVLPMLMHTEDGQNYLYADIMQENDYHCVEVFDLNQDTPVWVGEIASGMTVFCGRAEDMDTSFTTLPVNPSHFMMEDRINMFGTYNGQKQYAVMPGGMAEPLDEFFTVPYAMPVTTVKELPAEALDPGTLQPTGLSVMVPAGEELTIFRTNAVDFADMSRPDGSCVRVSLDSAGWPRTIAGEDEAAYFEMLYYAG